MRCVVYMLLALPLMFALSVAARADSVDDYIRAEMEKRKIPGLSLAVIKEGKILKAKGYGLANIETNTRATPETVYQLASVTKQFTATAIMLLVQDGKLKLEDPVGTYVEKSPDTWKDITIRHLLTHTSGLKDYLNEPSAKSREDTTLNKIVETVHGLPLNFAPGEKWAYSNTNYVLLAIIVQKVSGKPYDQFLAERVFHPLGMTATRRDDPDAVIPNRAAGYTRSGEVFKNSATLNPTLWDNGDGGMLSTVLDLAKWDAALYGETILTERSKQQMWAPVPLKDGKTYPYGFGWGTGEVQGHRCIWHNGGRDGTSTDFTRLVADKLTVIVLANVDDTNTTRIARRVAGFYIPEIAPPILKPIQDPEPESTARVKAMLAGFAQGVIDTSIFATETLPYLTDAWRTGIIGGFRNQGRVKSLMLFERTLEGDKRRCRYRVVYEKYSYIIGCEFNKDNKIVNLSTQLE